MSHDRPRLLLVTTTATTLRAFLLPYASRMRELGWHVDAVANGATACADIRAAFTAVFDAPWTRKLTDVRALLHAPGALRDLVRDGRYDVVHVHTPIAAFVTRFALRHQRRNVRVVYTAHGFHAHPRGSAIRNALFRAAERIAARWTDYLVVINAHDEALARRDTLVNPARLERHPGIGVDRRCFRRLSVEERSNVRAELGLTPNEPVIAVVGEFNDNKRQRDVVSAIARLANASGALVPCVLFLGEGPLRSTVEAQSLALGIERRVRFLGQRRDVAQLVGASDALVLPSEREGLPRCLLEAMACGVPVVASDIRGSRDLLSEERGILYPCGDVRRLADAMQEALSKSAQSRKRVEKALAWCAVEGDLDVVIRKHVALYDQLLVEARRAA